MLKNAMVNPLLPAADIDRAKRFYADRLGLAPEAESPGGAVYRCRDSWFFLYPSMGAGTNQATALEWLVDDLEAEMADLRSRGIVFEEYDFPGFKTTNGVAQLPEARSAWFKDSEGNLLAVSQITDPHIKAALGRT